MAFKSVLPLYDVSSRHGTQAVSLDWGGKCLYLLSHSIASQSFSLDNFVKYKDYFTLDYYRNCIHLLLVFSYIETMLNIFVVRNVCIFNLYNHFTH